MAKTRPLHHTKRRTIDVSGDGPERVPSHSRPSKPTAKAIHSRHSIALATGGGRIPAGIRRKLERRPLAQRTKPARPGPGGPRVTSTRAGKRTPRQAKKRGEAG